MRSISDLRQDIVSGDWVVIATGRAKRPHEFLKSRRETFRQSKAACPFEKLLKNPLLVYSPRTTQEAPPGVTTRGNTLYASRGVVRGSTDDVENRKNWWVQAAPNKYPAFAEHGVCALYHKEGPYQRTDGVGFHEVVVTRDHERSFALMSEEEAELVIRAYQERYLAMKEDGCVEYVSIFHNHGRQAGATIAHPHSQIIAVPVIPPDISRSLRGSASYFQKHKACVHCVALEYELAARERIIYENEFFVVLAPYASKTAFEMRLFPKGHAPHFEELDPSGRLALANALRSAMAKLHKGLNNPDYNFFLHTAPTGDAKEFHHYHWHFEILPKTAIWAGFEIGTGIEISVIAPEDAAAFLRKIKI